MKDVMMSVTQSVSQSVSQSQSGNLSLSHSDTLLLSSGFSSGSLTVLSLQPQIVTILRKVPLPPSPPLLMGMFSVPSCSHWFLPRLPDFPFVACQHFIILGGNKVRAENLTSVSCDFKLTSSLGLAGLFSNFL